MNKMNLFRENTLFTKEFINQVGAFQVEVEVRDDVKFYKGVNNSGKSTKMLYDIMNKLNKCRDLYCVYVSSEYMQITLDNLFNNIDDLHAFASVNMRLKVVDKLSKETMCNYQDKKFILGLDDVVLGKKELRLLDSFDDNIIERYVIGA